MGKQYLNVYGKPYGEDKDAFIQTFTARVHDECGDPIYFNVMHTAVFVGDGTVIDHYVVFDDDFFDNGVRAYSIDINGRGDDWGDIDGMIRDLVLEVVERYSGVELTLDERLAIIDDVTYEETNDGMSNEVKHAMWHYRNEEAKVVA